MFIILLRPLRFPHHPYRLHQQIILSLDPSKAKIRSQRERRENYSLLSLGRLDLCTHQSINQSAMDDEKDDIERLA